MAHFLVTGASGFVGSNLIPFLQERGHTVRAAVRRPGSAPEADDEFLIDDLNGDTNWDGAFTGVDAVIHLAARVHVMNESAADPLAEFRKTNVDGTKVLAVAALDAGVKRFVFLSSIKVNGEGGDGVVYTVEDAPAPEDPYGVSKLEAEEALRELEQLRDLEPVIIRTPLVYGPGVGGNFARLMKLAALPMPLPFGSVDNKRAMISVRNLSDSIEKSATVKEAAGSLLLVSDGNSMSTAELIRSLRIAQGKKPWLVPIPTEVMKKSLQIVGKQNLSDRLLGSLEIENGSTNSKFQWRPIETSRTGIERTMQSKTSQSADSEKHLVFVVTVDWFFISHRLPLAKEAVKRGYKVTVVAADSGQASEIREVGAGFIDFPFSRSGKNPINEFSSSVKLLSTLRKIKPTIVHFVALKPVMFGGFTSFFLPRKLKKVYAVTGFGHLFSSADSSQVVQRGILFFLRQAWSIRNSHVIVQNSDHFDSLREQKLIAEERLHLIEGAGVDLTKFKPGLTRSSPPLVVMAARLLKSKGVEEYISAAAMFEREYPGQLEFALIGPAGDDNPEAYSEQQLGELLQDTPVKWWGPRSDMDQVFSTSSIVVLPSFYAEGMPLVLIEAMAAGNQIITTDIPGCRQLVENSGVGLLVPPQNVQALFEALLGIVGQMGNWARSGGQARNFVKEHLSVERVIEDTFNVYEN